MFKKHFVEVMPEGCANVSLKMTGIGKLNKKSHARWNSIDPQFGFEHGNGN
jgi:hypothetical protein